MPTIIETLEYAYFNLVESSINMSHLIGKDQLKNAINLLDKGYDLDTNIEELINRYGSVENTPNINE